MKTQKMGFSVFELISVELSYVCSAAGGHCDFLFLSMAASDDLLLVQFLLPVSIVAAPLPHFWD